MRIKTWFVTIVVIRVLFSTLQSPTHSVSEALGPGAAKEAAACATWTVDDALTRTLFPFLQLSPSARRRRTQREPRTGSTASPGPAAPATTWRWPSPTAPAQRPTQPTAAPAGAAPLRCCMMLLEGFVNAKVARSVTEGGNTVRQRHAGIATQSFLQDADHLAIRRLHDEMLCAAAETPRWRKIRTQPTAQWPQ